MATKKIEIQDSDGNVYYPHTDASVVKNGSKTVAEQLNENAKGINTLSVQFFDIFTDNNILWNDIDKQYNYTIDYKDYFQKAVDSGYNLFIPSGNYYISGYVELNKPICIYSNGANIYIDPVDGENSYALWIKGDNIKIEGQLNIISSEEYTPKIGSMVTTGKTSNIYATYITGSNVIIDNLCTKNCFSIAYIAGEDNSNLIDNISIKNCNGINTCFGVFTRYVSNVNIEKCNIDQSTSGMNDYCHHIYIGTWSKYITIDSVILSGSSNSQYDTISLHDSILGTINIDNVKINNCHSTSKSRSFLTLADCSNVAMYNCSHYNMDTEYQKGLINITNDVSNIKIENCNFELYNVYSLVHHTNDKSIDMIKINNCDFNLKDTNIYIFRYSKNMIVENCNFYLSSTNENTNITLFKNDNEIITSIKNVKFIQCNIQIDKNTVLDKLLNNASTNSDYITFDNIYCVNHSLVNWVCTIVNNTLDNILISNSSFYNFNEISNPETPVKQINVFLSKDTE